MMKFDLETTVKVLPFKLKGKRDYPMYSESMLPFIGRWGVITGYSDCKPKYQVTFYRDDGKIEDFWWFYSSDLEAW